jgi:carboxyl-terminal processing protease
MKTRLKFAAILTVVLLSRATHAEEHLTGIGIQASVQHDALTVIHVIPNSPASKAGLSERLFIQKIDGTPTAGKSLKECVDLIRGKVGTKVKLELVDTTLSKTNTVVLTRAEVKPNIPTKSDNEAR